jgi:hypothetical protein
MRTVVTLGALLLLTACASPEPVVVTSTKYRVVMPEDSMFTCETVSRFPEPRTLTDLQVARLLAELHQNNVRCRNSMQAIRQFLDDAKIRVEEGREPPARPETPVPAPAAPTSEQPRQRRVPIR